MRSSTDRSYLGIASCALFAPALGMMAELGIANSGTDHKLEGLELIFIAPCVVLLHACGVLFALRGLSDRSQNPGALLGIALNSAAMPVRVIGWGLMSQFG